LSFEELLAELGPLCSANKSEKELTFLNAQLKPWLRELREEVANVVERKIHPQKWDAPEILLWLTQQKLGTGSGLGFLNQDHQIGEPLQGNLVLDMIFDVNRLLKDTDNLVNCVLL
jgi:hypothetical protein